MDALVAIQPENTVLVVGPAFAGSLLGGNCSKLFPLTFTTIRDKLEGVWSKLQRKSNTDGLLLQDHLKEKGLKLSRYLQDIFTTSGWELIQTPLLARLMKLQDEGALLVSLQVDGICEDAMQRSGFAPNQLDLCTKSNGVYHPFSYYRDSQSFQSMLQSVESGRSWDVLPEFAQMLKHKTCVCIGFDHEQDNIFLKAFMHLTASCSCDVLLLNAVVSGNDGLPTVGLPNVQLPEGLEYMKDKSKEIVGAIEFPLIADEDNNYKCLSLVLAAKNQLSPLIKLISKIGGVNFVLMATHDDLRNLTFHSLSLRLTARDFGSFWSRLTSEKMVKNLLEHTVQAIVLPYGTIIWLNKNNTGIISDKNKDVVPQLPPSVKIKPRWTVLKHKVTNGLTSGLYKDDGTPVPTSVLRRRLSLPPHLTTSSTQPSTKSRATPPTTGHYQQLLLNKQLFKQKNNNKSTEPTQLKKLLQEKKKIFPAVDKSEGSTFSMLEDWTKERRKNLFVNEGKMWSDGMNKVLARKNVKWRKIQDEKEAVALARQEQERRNRGSSCESDGVRQYQMATTSLYKQQPSPLPLNPSPPTISAPFYGSLPFGTPPLLYPAPFIQSFHQPFINPYIPTIIPQVPPSPLSPNILLTTRVPPTTLQSQVISTTPMKPQTTQYINGATEIIHRNNSLPKVPIGKRSRSNSIVTTKSSHSNIVSLLQQKQELDPPPVKLSRTTTPNSIMDDQSDDDEESSSSAESRYGPLPSQEGQLPLWQFLLDLLLNNSHSDYIQWDPYTTLQFEIRRPKEVVKLWRGALKDESADFSCFKRILNYYCVKSPPILYSIKENAFVFRYSHSVMYYINMRYSQQLQNSLTTSITNTLTRSSTRDISTSSGSSHEVLVVD
jgi:hypothetical protein